MPSIGTVFGVGNGVRRFDYTHSFSVGTGLNVIQVFLSLVANSSFLTFTVGFANIVNNAFIDCGSTCRLYADIAVYYQNPETYACSGPTTNWDWIVGKSYTSVQTDRSGCTVAQHLETGMITIDGVQYL